MRNRPAGRCSAAVGGILLLAAALVCRTSAAEDLPTLRFAFMAVVQAGDLPARPVLTLVSKRINKRPPHIGFEYTVQDEKNHVFKHGFMKMFTANDLSFDDCRTRFCLLQVKMGHGCEVRGDTPYCFVATEENFLQIRGFKGKFYFYVPEHCAQIRILARATSVGEGASLRLLDPDGGVAATTGGEIGTWEQGRMEAKPEAKHCGRVWAVEVSGYPGLMLDDLHLAVAGDVPPLLSVKPEWAALIGPCLVSVPETAAKP